MKFGVNTFLWTGNFGPEHFDLLPKIKQNGFDGIEVALIRPVDFKAAEIRKRLRRLAWNAQFVRCCRAS